MFHCIDKKKAAESLYPRPTVPAVYHWADWDANKKYDFSDVNQSFDMTFSVDTANKLLDGLGFRKGADGIRVDDKDQKVENLFQYPGLGTLFLMDALP